MFLAPIRPSSPAAFGRGSPDINCRRGIPRLRPRGMTSTNGIGFNYRIFGRKSRSYNSLPHETSASHRYLHRFIRPRLFVSPGRLGLGPAESELAGLEISFCPAQSAYLGLGHYHRLPEGLSGQEAECSF